jgi:3-oxoacyl-[acyl-carrier-protein] synthase III
LIPEVVTLQAYIESVGAYVPDRIVTNEELARNLDTSDEWIFTHTGIRERRIAADGERASDMACLAAERALDRSSITALDIDLILLATSTPDFVGFPSTAAIVQHRIGATRAGAMDLFAACTGFIYAVETARAFIASGTMKHVLVIASEVFSKILDWNDRNTCVLFGDGAGAVVVSRSPEPGTSRIVAGTLRSQGEGADSLYVDPTVQMDGRRVYTFAVKALCDTIEELLDIEPTPRERIGAIVPHQANVRIITAAGKRLGLAEELFYLNMERFANTSAASIPLAMNEMYEKGMLERGMVLLTIGFGGGLTYGGNLIYW